MFLAGWAVTLTPVLQRGRLWPSPANGERGYIRDGGGQPRGLPLRVVEGIEFGIALGERGGAFVLLRAQLHVVDILVETADVHKLFMRAAFHDLSFVEDKRKIGAADG